MSANRVPLCRNCGVRIFWEMRYKRWMHRYGGVPCHPYSSVSAEPTFFRRAEEVG